ncbi:acyl-CoA N-acyltransferase [Amniculicola lignicola CBS 123094]|uniref:Acyl-CoA N-acyltransferase n=1 Tax=Amniculicola lignicola CBS 123094 TaxID=1392246 RepID=A0A6A5X588_9PLEO|nr:acyl-CoA N-acyltransferase [Amniculicola lignicola CBS 123094]
MPPSTNPKNPFHSSRLIYRAVLFPEDNSLFNAINDDHIGFQNSNAGNHRLPGRADAEKFQKHASECLLGAVICLPKFSEMTAVEKSNIDAEAKDEKIEEYAEAGVAIGQILLAGLSPNMKHHRSAEIGIDILPPYQGKGYGTEAINWVLAHAFRRVGLHRVDIRAFEWNDGAVRLYKKLGFKEEGRKREALWHEGRWWDGIDMGMLEREWWEMERRRTDSEGSGS